MLSAALLGSGCAGQSSFKMVKFQAPSRPDPVIYSLLEGVDRIGVLSVTNIEPLRELDVEKVMGRLADAVARALRRTPDMTVVSQDEIRWHFEYAAFDSLSLFSQETRTRLREELELDAMIYVELKRLQAMMTPVSPTPYGTMTSAPGMDVSVSLQVTLSNLHTNAIWRPEQREQRNWQPVELQLFGGNQVERQLMMALSRPLQEFLMRVAPPPGTQVRHFEISGD